MAHTAEFCRAQEAVERERASGAVLENVRTVATRSAAAWAQEAVLAERRENNRRTSAGLPDAASTSEEDEDRVAGETVDREIAA